MKRSMAALLAVLMLCTLTACKKPGPTQETTEAALPTEDTTEAAPPLERMEQYFYIADALECFENTASTAFSVKTPDGTLSSGAAWKYCYDQLVALESIDAWLNEDAWAKHMPHKELPNLDRKGLLSKFHFIQGGVQRIAYADYESDERMESEDEYVVWHYNEDGTVSNIENGAWRLEQCKYLCCGTDILFEYDGSGRIAYMRFGHAMDTASGFTVTCDDFDHIVKLQEGEISIDFAYDEAGRLMQAVYKRPFIRQEEGEPVYIEDRWEYAYTCDAEGRVVKKVETYTGPSERMIDTRVCTYNAEGLLAEEVSDVEQWREYDGELMLRSTWHHRYSYTYDNLGRLLTKTKYPGPRKDVEGPVVQPGIDQQVETYFYCDQYFYGEYSIPYPSYNAVNKS